MVKIGSSILTDNEGNLSDSSFGKIASQISRLREKGIKVIMVSSGAIASGMKKLNIDKRPVDIHMKQAIAASGQTTLMWKYEKAFLKYETNVAQLLLTHDGLSNRKRFLNARRTIYQLLAMDIIPIVNENDTVAVDEIMFGDNDNLAALVTSLTEADLLVLLTDIDGLYDKDPRKHSDARFIPQIAKIDSEIEKTAGITTGKTTVGGMISLVGSSTWALAKHLGEPRIAIMAARASHAAISRADQALFAVELVHDAMTLIDGTNILSATTNKLGKHFLNAADKNPTTAAEVDAAESAEALGTSLTASSVALIACYEELRFMANQYGAARFGLAGASMAAFRWMEERRLAIVEDSNKLAVAGLLYAREHDPRQRSALDEVRHTEARRLAGDIERFLNGCERDPKTHQVQNGEPLYPGNWWAIRREFTEFLPYRGLNDPYLLPGVAERLLERMTWCSAHADYLVSIMAGKEMEPPSHADEGEAEHRD